MTTTYTNLRKANLARQAEWDGEKKVSIDYQANELFGEAGEAANVIKKLERERLGIRGSRDTVEHLAEELADVVICVDLLAIGAGLNEIQVPPIGNLHIPTLVQGGNMLAARIGAACSLIERRKGGLSLACAIDDVLLAVALIAQAENIDLDAALAAKFNATSEKVGLKTRLAA